MGISSIPETINTPAVHHTTHNTGGTDPIAPADIGAQASVITTQGDIPVGDASGVAVRKAKETDGRFLAYWGNTPSGLAVPPWVKKGASTLVAAFGNGDPGLPTTLLAAAMSPNTLGTTTARCVQFRLPFALAVAHVWVYGRLTLASACEFAIYPAAASSSILWQSGTISLTANTWLDITASTPFTVAADTDYLICVATNTSSATACIDVFNYGFPNAAFFGADAAPLGGLRGIGMPVPLSFTVTAGAFPGTLPAIAAMASTASHSPRVWLEGTSS